MSNLHFLRLSLLSRREKSARTVVFHPQTTLLVGDNDVGKSRILKSVVSVFGADPEGLDKRWKAASVDLLLDFTVDNQEWSIYRSGKLFVLRKGANGPFESFAGVSSGLAERLAGILSFALRLPDKRSGAPVVPPPAYYFLPFYIDQDDGWSAPWRGLQNLGQFGNWKRDVAEYHAGVRTNVYYELKAALDALRVAQAELARESHALAALRDRVRPEVDGLHFDLEGSAFKERGDQLVEESRALHRAEERHRMALASVVEEMAAIEHDRRWIQRALDELSADIREAADSTATLRCPQCGTLHENSFVRQYGMGVDIAWCETRLLELEATLLGLKERRHSVEKALLEAIERAQALDQLLQTEFDGHSLKSIVKAEGRKHLRVVLFDEQTRLDEELRTGADAVRQAERRLEVADDRERRRRVQRDFVQGVRRAAGQLDVSGLDQVDDIRLDASSRDLGSDGSRRARARLAHFAAFLGTAKSFAETAFAPIIIDTPKQQEPDPKNAQAIMSLILETLGSYGQLILATRSEPVGTSFAGSVLRFEHKMSLLTSVEYEATRARVRPFEMMLAGQLGLF